MEVTPDLVKQLLDNRTKPSDDFNLVLSEKTDSFVLANNKKPNSSQIKYIYASSFVDMFDFRQ